MSVEAFRSLLLEIVIMLTLWYLGYWEHAFKTSILSAVIQKEYSPFSWIITILPEKIVIYLTSETNNGFCLFNNLTHNLFFKYLLYNRMASFFCISVASAQLKREFANQHHMKCRPSSGPAPVSVCLSHDVKAALRYSGSNTFYLDGYRNSANHLWHLPVICHLLTEKASDWAAKIYVSRDSKPVSVAQNSPFSPPEAKSKSPPCNANQNMGVSVWQEKGRKGKIDPMFLKLSFF